MNEKICCPNCGQIGTDVGCKDFTCLSLGEYLCRVCHYRWSVFKKVPDNATKKERKEIIKYNVRTAINLLDSSQNKAIDAILTNSIKNHPLNRRAKNG